MNTPSWRDRIVPPGWTRCGACGGDGWWLFGLIQYAPHPECLRCHGKGLVKA
jgi:hypothetical protein